MYISVPIDTDSGRISPIKYSKQSLESEVQCETKGWVRLIGSVSFYWKFHEQSSDWKFLLNAQRTRKYSRCLQTASITVLDPANTTNCDRSKRPNNFCTVIQNSISCGVSRKSINFLMHEECNFFSPRKFPQKRNWKLQFYFVCFHVGKNRTDSIFYYVQLDVGSPLVCKNMIYGIMDRQLTANCTCDSGSYLDISSYFKWIELNKNRSTRVSCDIFLIVGFVIVKFLIWNFLMKNMCFKL